jgi:hypothetical protein
MRLPNGEWLRITNLTHNITAEELAKWFEQIGVMIPSTNIRKESHSNTALIAFDAPVVLDICKWLASDNTLTDSTGNTITPQFEIFQPDKFRRMRA